MATTGEHIQTFRDTVDTVIANNAGRYSGDWPDKLKFAQHGSVRYHSVPGNEGGALLGLGGDHRWSIEHEGLRVRNYLGAFSIVAVAGNDASLWRVWRIHTPLTGPFSALYSKRELTDEDDIESAVTWGRSPILEAGIAACLGELTDDEVTAIAKGYDDREQQAIRNEQAGEELLAARRRHVAAMPNDLTVGTAAE